MWPSSLVPDTKGMGVLEFVSESKTYRMLRTVRRWAANSVVLSVLGRERVQAGLVSAFALASVASVFATDLGAGVQFLSFLLLFVGLSLLAARVVDPPTD